MPTKKGKADPRPGKSARAASRGDDPASRGDRSKRLLDLVMILLRARMPVTYRDIREQFPAYQTLNSEAGLRAFERDKADLLDLGVPIRYITPDEDDSLEDGGYVIDLKRFKMPEVRLTPDEISALVLAASVAHAMPGGAYPKIVDLALKKLAFDLPELPDTPTEFPRPAPVLVHFPERRIGVRAEFAEIYATIEAATRYRKRVTLTYQAAATGMKSRREIDPYALIYRESAWLVVGWCHLRREVRTFRVDRIHEAVMAPRPKSADFERPADFDVKAYAQRSPWTFTSDPPEEIQIALAPEAAEVGNEDLGLTAVKRIDGDRTLVTFDCSNLEFAATRILAAKGAIRLLRGHRLRARIHDELDAIAAHYPEEVPEVPEVGAAAGRHNGAHAGMQLAIDGGMRPDSTPEIPNMPSPEPEIPGIPADPGREIPTAPRVPGAPGHPETPDVPSGPEKPEIPEVPDHPGEPVVPEAPKTPKTPPRPGEVPVPRATDGDDA